LPDAPHRAARRACPEAQFAAMKPVNIKILWYNRLYRTGLHRRVKAGDPWPESAPAGGRAPNVRRNAGSIPMAGRHPKPVVIR